MTTDEHNPQLERAKAGCPETVLGVISDTHGLLRPEAVSLLRGSHIILHAGDIGAPTIIDSLSEIAPVVAVRGNVDGAWARKLPETAVVEIGSTMIYMLHDLSKLDLKPEMSGFAAVIFGHSHKPMDETRNGVLFFNPGSAGPRRFRLRLSVGKLVVSEGRIMPELMPLQL